ncbi:MAG: hypothetical protein KBA82_00545 [Nitrosomonas sp.]|nr:hypothetical protein [Nitrosomonas sp.]MBP7111486.1 hypothetical protein [Nitrosomonas sp.]
MLMEKGFGYLVAIMDWHSRKVLSWRLSNTLDADFCIQALEAAIHQSRPLERMASRYLFTSVLHSM